MSASFYPSKWTSDELLKAMEHLPPSEVDLLYTRLRSLRRGRHGASAPVSESALLAQINRGFSESWWKHYEHLLEKRRNETLNKGEHKELVRLTDQVEGREAKRMQALVQLAGLRKQSLRSLMKDLGLMASSHA